jgi:hypothetical protein
MRTSFLATSISICNRLLLFALARVEVARVYGEIPLSNVGDECQFFDEVGAERTLPLFCI